MLGILNGTLFTLAETLTDPALVISWFLARLGASNFLIGLIVPLRDGGWYLPQLFTSRRLGTLTYKMPVYRAMAFVRTLTWIIITIAVFWVRSPALLLACFVTMYAVNSLAGGIAGLPFMDITAKTIPPRQRGRYFGERLFWGSILSIGGGYLVKLALEGQLGLAFPANVGLLMLLTTILTAIALTLFIQTIEPPTLAPVQATSLGNHLRLALRLPVRDHNFRLYLLARIALIIGSIATPFLAVYATRQLGASAGMIGIYLGARTASSLLSNRWWSWLADQHSGRLVMQSSAIQALAAMLIALTLAPIAQTLKLTPSIWSWLYTLVFILLGSSNTAIGVAGSSLMLNLSPEDERSLYVGFANTLLGIALLLTSFGGFVVDLTGYAGVFTLAAACYGVGILTIARMQDAPGERKP